jgi:hypothetical protein
MNFLEELWKLDGLNVMANLLVGYVSKDASTYADADVEASSLDDFLKNLLFFLLGFFLVFPLQFRRSFDVPRKTEEDKKLKRAVAQTFYKMAVGVAEKSEKSEKSDKKQKLKTKGAEFVVKVRKLFSLPLFLFFFSFGFLSHVPDAQCGEHDLSAVERS